MPAVGQHLPKSYLSARIARAATDHHQMEVVDMKTMTCKQMGGPCETKFHGDTADEVIKADDKHLKEMVDNGDQAHMSARKTMQDRWKHPVSGMKWYSTMKKDFAALPED